VSDWGEDATEEGSLPGGEMVKTEKSCDAPKRSGSKKPDDSLIFLLRPGLIALL
jgi:hypothetical protein